MREHNLYRSFLNMFDLRRVKYAKPGNAYSNTGRIKVQKIVNKSAAGTPFCFKIRRANNLLLALAHMLSTWILHVRSLEIVIPRSLKLCTISSEMLLMVRWSIADGVFSKRYPEFFRFLYVKAHVISFCPGIDDVEVRLEHSIIGWPGNDFICSAIVYILIYLYILIITKLLQY